MPARARCWPMSRTSSGSAARAAFRCLRRGRRRFGLGAADVAGERRLAPSAPWPDLRRPLLLLSGPEALSLRLSEALRRSSRSLRPLPPLLPSLRPPFESPSRRGLLSLRPERPFFARVVMTSGSLRPLPRISSRSGLPLPSFGARTAVISMPSTNCSVSARSRSPTETPSGSSVASTAPRGSRAPAALHVQEPSSRLLVSSISMRGMAHNASRQEGDGDLNVVDFPGTHPPLV